MSNQSPGQIAFEVAGTVIGAYAGNAALGFEAGALIGGALFPPELPKGPRIDDAGLSTSSYGGAIALNWGTNRLPGNLIWADEPQHRTQTVSSGKSDQDVDAIFQSFAMAFCAGPGTVLRIWFDSKLVYDATPGSTRGFNNFQDTQAGQALQQIMDAQVIFSGASGSLRFYDVTTFYEGTEEQLPDPTMEAALGVGSVPAYRGMCYGVFKDVPLAPYGNRIPTVRAEIAGTSESNFPKRLVEPHPDSPLDDYTPGEIAWDKARGVLYEHDSSGACAESGLRVISYPEMQETRWRTDADLFGATCFVNYRLNGVSPLGSIYLCLTDVDHTPLVLLDPDLLQLVGGISMLKSGSPTQYVETRYMGFQRDALGRVWALICGVDNSIAILEEEYLLSPVSDVDSLAYLGSVQESNAVGACGGSTTPGSREAWFLGADSATLALYGAQITHGLHGYADRDRQSSATVERVKAFDLATEFPSVMPGAEARMVGYDSSDNSLVLIVQNAAIGYYLVKIDLGSATHAIVWKHFVAVVGLTYDPPYAIAELSQRTFCVGGGTIGAKFYQHHLTDGSVIDTHALADYPSPSDVQGASQFWDSSLGVVYVSDDQLGDAPGLYFIGRAGGQITTVGDIVEGISLRSGLSAGQFDVSQLTDLVNGYTVQSAANARAMLEPLMAAYFFDAVESDYKIKFVKRGGAAVASIPQADLAPADQQNSSAVAKTRTQEIDLPDNVTVNYPDYTRDYLTGTAQSRRVALPSPTQFSRNSQNISLTSPALSMSPTRAKRIADTALYEAWGGRDSYALKAGWKYLALDPADPVTLQLDSGNYRVRLMQANIGADFSLDLAGPSDDASIFDASDAVSSGGLGAGTVIASRPGSEVFPIIFDSTLLNDSDDTGGSTTRYYQTMEPFKSEDFGGGYLLRSSDGSSYTLRAPRVTTVPAYGKCLTALPTIADETIFTIQGEAYVDVQLLHGSAPSSVSDSDFFAGVNTLAVQRTDGQVEWVQFRDVADLGGGAVRCSYLLRGRRGSEAYASGHSAGDKAIFVNAVTATAGFLQDSLDLGSIGALRYFDAIFAGQDVDEGHKTSRSISGNDLKPYAPVHLAQNFDAGSPGDRMLSWVRRTRLGGEWRDGTGDVPLAETSEAYDVEILSGGAVIRTKRVTEALARYAHEEMIEDFGGVPSGVTFKVYQVSAAVGRGFAATYSPP